MEPMWTIRLTLFLSLDAADLATGEGAGGVHSLRQRLWEKDSSSRSHSSCRLPLPLQVQLKATLVLTLLTKLGVIAVPVG